MMDFTKEQLKIINHSDGHAIVSAVAGSGKTQTLVGRVAKLLQNHADPSRILVVMFNKAAKNQFEERLENHLGIAYDPLLQVKTFHALGYTFISSLVQNQYLLNYNLVTNNYKFDNLIKKALQQTYQLSKKHTEITAELIEQYSNYFALIKSEPVPPSQNSNLKKLAKGELKLIEIAYTLFEKYRQQEQIRSFDDLIYEPALFFKKNPNIARKYAENYDYIIVDEYQDINRVQEYLLKILAGNGAQVMVVGDVDQTIYEWRGSKPYYMLRGFARDFKGAKFYTLSQTFRYGHRLSLTANYVIANNKQRHKNLCISNIYSKNDTAVEILWAKELAKTPEKINHFITENNADFEDVGVLVRKYSSVILFELECLKKGIPYKIIGGQGVFSSGIVSSMLGYLYLANEAQFLSTIPKSQRESIIYNMLFYPSLYVRHELLKPIVKALSSNPNDGENILYNLSLDNSLKPFQAERIRYRAFIWGELLNLSTDKNCFDTWDDITEQLKLKTYLESDSNSDNNSLIDISEALLNYAKETKFTIEEFICHIENLKRTANARGFSKYITITTIHRAKGLEWPLVILLDMTEKSFFGKDSPDIATVESERRLMYVAMTRAQKHLLIVAGNDKAKLEKWYEEGDGKAPDNLRANNSIRYIYEMNLPICHSYADALVEGLHTKPKLTAKNKLADKYWTSVT